MPAWRISAKPARSFVLNLETPANYPGIAGRLGGVDLGTLAHPSEHLPALIILAPGGRVARTALRAALARLQRPDERLAAITLLVPVSEACMLGGALTVAERFTVAWDVSACPHEKIVEFARWLAAQRLCDEESFAGLFPYATGKLGLTHSQRLKKMLGPFALRAPVIRDTITSA
jgi:hypothetical protein